MKLCLLQNRKSNLQAAQLPNIATIRRDIVRIIVHDIVWFLYEKSLMEYIQVQSMNIYFFFFLLCHAVVDLNLLKEEVRLYSCTPRNFSVSIREELKRTDTIFWPGCLLVKRCGGNCACCLHNCNECQCVPSKVTKKYHEVGISFYFWVPLGILLLYK